MRPTPFSTVAAPFTGPLLLDPRASASGVEDETDRPRRWWRWLLAGWLAQAAVRMALAAGQTTPVANPDEAGYLLAARVLAGGPAGDISPSTPYRGGYPLLLVPAFWLSDDPQTVYRIATVVNALVSALLLVAAYQLLRRLGLTRGGAYALGHVTALLPAAVFYTQYALTDAILPVVVLGWLLLLHSWLVSDEPVRRVALYGAGAGFLAAYAFTMHSRGVVIVAVHAGVLLVAVVRRWRPWWSAGIGAVVAVAVMGAGSLLNDWIWPKLYPRGSYDMGAMLVDRLTTPGGYGWTIPVGLGQVWYLIVGTWGLAGAGLAAVTAFAVRRQVPPRLRALAIALIVTIAGVAFATAAALPDEERVGNHAYSRYLACLAPILFAIGVAVLLQVSRRTARWLAGAAAAMIVAGSLLIQVRAAAKFDHYVFFPFDFPETSFLTWDWTSFRLWAATLAALVLLAALVGLLAWERHGAALLAGVLLVINAAASTASAMEISRPFVRDLTAASELGDLAKPGDRIAIDQRIEWQIWIVQMYQISWSPVLLFDSRKQGPDTSADLVLHAWPEGVAPDRTWQHAPAGWHVVGSRRTGQGAWVAWARR